MRFRFQFFICFFCLRASAPPLEVPPPLLDSKASLVSIRSLLFFPLRGQPFLSRLPPAWASTAVPGFRCVFSDIPASTAVSFCSLLHRVVHRQGFIRNFFPPAVLFDLPSFAESRHVLARSHQSVFISLLALAPVATTCPCGPTLPVKGSFL